MAASSNFGNVSTAGIMSFQDWKWNTNLPAAAAHICLAEHAMLLCVITRYARQCHAFLRFIQ